MGINSDHNGTRDIAQSLFSGDPTIWVITTLDPRAEGKTHPGEDENDKYVIDTVFPDGHTQNGSTPPDYNQDDEDYQGWFDNGEWKIYSQIITNQEGQYYTYHYDRVTQDMSICSGVGVYAYKLNSEHGLVSEAKAVYAYKGDKNKTKGYEYVKDVEEYMISLGDNLEGYNEFMESK